MPWHATGITVYVRFRVRFRGRGLFLVECGHEANRSVAQGERKSAGGLLTPQKNEIVVYQPNDIMRIEVRFEDETVWLQQPRIAELFACSLENVRLHLKNPEVAR